MTRTYENHIIGHVSRTLLQHGMKSNFRCWDFLSAKWDPN